MSHVICKHCKTKILKWQAIKRNFKGDIGNEAHFYLCKDVFTCRNNVMNKKVKQYEQEG